MRLADIFSRQSKIKLNIINCLQKFTYAATAIPFFEFSSRA